MGSKGSKKLKKKNLQTKPTSKQTHKPSILHQALRTASNHKQFLKTFQKAIINVQPILQQEFGSTFTL